VGESQFRRLGENTYSTLPTLWYRSSETMESKGSLETEGFIAGEDIGVQREGKERKMGD
jgi:hypothetical protein